MRIAALGSSFAAGPGIDPVVDRAARRSGRNYAHLLAERLGADLTDLTVSGATTATLVDEPQRLRFGRRFAPQVTGIPTDADLVTVTAGGNDLGYAAGLMRAAWAGRLQELRPARTVGQRLAREAVPAITDADVERATAGLVRVVAAVRQRAPGARVVLVDYLTILGERTRTGPAVPLDATGIAAFRRIGDRLAGAFADAAGRSSADLVRISAASVDHTLGCDEPWVTGFTLRMSPAPFHPNEAGMRAVADALERMLTT